MDRIDAGDLRRADDVRYVEVRARRLRRPDAIRFVRHADVKRIAVGLGEDRDRLHAELFARADDAQRDLAAVGDQYFVEHVVSLDFLAAMNAWDQMRGGSAP